MSNAVHVIIALVLGFQIVPASILEPAWTIGIQFCESVQFCPNFHHTIHWLDDQKQVWLTQRSVSGQMTKLWKTMYLCHLVFFSCLYWSQLCCVVDAPREVFWRQNATTARCAFLRDVRRPLMNFPGSLGWRQSQEASFLHRDRRYHERTMLKQHFMSHFWCTMLELCSVYTM